MSYVLVQAGAASLIFQTLLLAASVAVFFASPAHNTPLLMLFLGLVVSQHAPPPSLGWTHPIIAYSDRTMQCSTA